MLMIIVTMVSALFLAGVAAYFSIVGLGILFAAYFWPVVIMGTAIEIGKLVATSWVYRSWEYSPRLIRWPLIVAIIGVMLVTSMGIYGFLSKGHLEIQGPIEEQKIEVVSIESDVNLIRERIAAVDEENLYYRKELDNLQAIIDGYPDNWPTKKSLKMVEQQPRREAINKSIEENRQLKSEQIVLLRDKNKEKSVANVELNKQEADLGPIKYVAAALGINPDQGVRFIILLIIFVFDPLAILLILAANVSIVRKFGIDQKKVIKVNPVEVVEDEIPTLTELLQDYPTEVEEPVVEEPVVEEPKGVLVEREDKGKDYMKLMRAIKHPEDCTHDPEEFASTEPNPTINNIQKLQSELKQIKEKEVLTEVEELDKTQIEEFLKEKGINID